MILAFGAVAVLTAIAAAIAWVSFLRVENELHLVTAERLPALTQSIALVDQAAALTASAPALAAARDRRNFEGEQWLLNARTEEFTVALTELENRASGDTRRILSLSRQILANLANVDATLSKRLDLSEAITTSLQTFADTNTRFRLVLQPMANAIKVRSGLSTRQLLGRDGMALPQGEAREKRLFEAMADNYARLQTVLELKADGTLLAGLVNLAPNITDVDQLPTMENNAGDAQMRIHYRVATLPEGPRTALAELEREFEGVILGAGNLFHLQRQRLEAGVHAEALLTENRRLSTELGVLVQQRLATEEKLIAEATQTAHQAMRLASVTLLALAATSLVTAILLAGLFAGPLFGRRLHELAEDLRAIAAGRLDTPIKVTGTDELGELADGLRAFRDAVAERQHAEDQLAQLANYDALTGLPNRNLLSDRVHQALASARRMDTMFALMFIDLDRFKLINDTQGHEVGDRVLKQMSNRLEQCMRSSDTVGRLGGDEFAVIARELNHVHDIALIAQKVLNTLNTPLELEGHTYFIGASIGISLCPADGADYGTLLRKADTAMYIAKEQGGGRFQFFSEEMNRRAEARFALENRLRAALQEHQFELWYQPKAEFDSGRIVGVEALIRWHSPGEGYRSPAEFIPVAEQSHLIEDIGAWVLKEACRHCMAWRAQGFGDITVAVNISSRQLANPGNLRRAIDEALGESGLPPQLLELEVTESAMLLELKDSIALLKELQTRGHIIAVDDFGTGYSSLSYIRHLPIDVLKIDKSFVDGVITDPTDAAVASAIIALGRSLNLTIVAEGVEDAAQHQFLAERGCHCAQGYYLSRPLPYQELVLNFLPGRVPLVDAT